MCSCQTEQSPVNTLADRVTEGTSKDRILFRMIADENNPLKDYFEISSEDGKVLITGNSDLSPESYTISCSAGMWYENGYGVA